jgi:hypothetical protein
MMNECDAPSQESNDEMYFPVNPLRMLSMWFESCDMLRNVCGDRFPGHLVDI